MSEHNDQRSEAAGNSWIFTAVLLVLLFFSLIWYAKLEGCSSAKHKVSQTSGATTQQTAPVTQPTQPPQTIVMGQQKTTHKFSAQDGCVTVNLHGNWSDYPIGGRINFASVETGEIVYTDAPDEQHTPSLPTGWYKICKTDKSNATGVDIWQ